MRFVKQHTTGFDDFIQSCRDTSWTDIEQESGLTQSALREAADAYIAAEKVIGVYGMGLTQHTHGALNIAMLVNLLLLRGNIGRRGRAAVRCVGTAMCRVSARLALPRRPSWFRWTS